ncbi:hypothetical protein V6000_006417 [Aspergillus fumigatus]
MSDVSTTLGSAERDCASTQQYLSRTEEQLQGIDLFIMCCISAKIHRKAPSNNNLPRRKQSNLPQLRFPLWHILILFSTVDKLLASLIINIPTIKSYNMSSVSEKGQEGHLQQHSVYRRLCEDVDKLTSFLSLVRKKRPFFIYLNALSTTSSSSFSQSIKLVYPLTCKLFFDLFGSVLKGEEFRFPRLLHNRIPRHCLKKPEILQNQLLLQLEDAGWRLCGKCLRLYPRREVSMSLLRSLSTKTINDLRRYC